MSEANEWVLTQQEIRDILKSIPVGESRELILYSAQFGKAVWNIVDWLFTHETDGKMTSGGRAWAARLTKELEDAGHTRSSS